MTELDKLTRRRFISVASAFGISAASLRLGTQKGLAKARDGPKEVPYVARMRVKRDDNGRPIGRRPVYHSVPRDVWEDMRASIRAASKVNKIIERKFPETDNISAGMTSMQDSPTGGGVQVDLLKPNSSEIEIPAAELTKDDLRAKLPDKVNVTVGGDQWQASRSGIPVVIDEVFGSMGQNSQMASSDLAYKHTWDAVPGGCVVGTETVDSYSTANASFWRDSTGSYYLTTAGHVAPHAGENWGNPSIESTDGTVVESHGNTYGTSNKDYALLSVNTDQAYSIRNIDDNNPDTQYRVAGAVTDDELACECFGDYNKPRDNPLTFQGCKTGRVKGLNVKEIDPGDKSVADDQRVEWGDEVPTYSGDSGGIYYFLDEYDQAIICGMHQRENGSGTKGPTAEAIENGLNGYFA